MPKTSKTAPLPARRSASLSAVPRRTPLVRTATTGEKLHVTARFQRPRWQRFLGAATTLERTFALDKYGRQVYEACDGERTILEVIRLFADTTRVSLPEAEIAVAKFVHTLVCKGLLVIEMEKPPHG